MRSSRSTTPASPSRCCTVRNVASARRVPDLCMADGSSVRPVRPDFKENPRPPRVCASPLATRLVALTVGIMLVGAARDQMYSQEELARHFSHTFSPRTTNRYSCIILHRHHFAVRVAGPLLVTASGVSYSAPPCT